MERESSSQSFLGCHSKQLGDQSNLASHIPFVNPLSLSFSHHIHHLESLDRSPGRFERKEAHPRLGQACDEPMVLFDQVVEVFHQDGNSTC